MARRSLDALRLPDAAEFHDLTRPMPRARERDVVLLAVHDLVSLRRAVTGLGNFGPARRIGVWIERGADHLPTVTAQAAWPPLEELVASRSAERFVLLTFSAPAPVRPVFIQVARAASPSQELSTGWPTLGVRRDQPWLWPAADPSAIVAMPRRLYDATTDSPPDLVVTEDADEVPDTLTSAPHPVLGRVPELSHIEPDLTWDALASWSTETTSSELRRRGPLSLGAIDEGLLNPIGFDRTPCGDPLPLRISDARRMVAGDGSGGADVQLTHHGLSEADVPPLRRLPGLTLDWRGGSGPQDYCRTVASLAMAGVPLVTDAVPAWARSLLSEELAQALVTSADLTDALAREEHSVRLRRAALRSHATGPWRRALARRHGLQATPPPLVSVLLVTRRPEMLGFALRQVARQHGVTLEVVLATHGFDADPAAIAAFQDASDAPLTTFRAEASTLFGEVLNQAAARSSGDVLLKMDDDDWYAKDFAADLLLAREYSGAEIVGCSSEFTFVEPLWVTTRRPDESEVYRPFVAGGTIMIDRAAFQAVGGFRHVRKHVDAHLLSATLDSGGRVYRSHGLGYVLRRGAQGHTWDPGLGYFVTRRRAAQQWRGFSPSVLIEADSDDLPAKPLAGRNLA